MEISQNKALRKQYKAVRDSLSLEERLSKSEQITNQFKALLESDFKRANIFLCFYPFGSEVSLLDFYEWLLKNGKEIYFPISDNDNHKLIFKQVTDFKMDFHSGFRGINEPHDSLKTLDYNSEMVVITPGLVFDNNGNRIGYGAGFYDRFFAEIPSAIKVAVCFDKQLTEKIIPEEHDIQMDYIVTNNGIIRR